MVTFLPNHTFHENNFTLYRLISCQLTLSQHKVNTALAISFSNHLAFKNGVEPPIPCTIEVCNTINML